jgi:hypothetical protein
VKLGRQGSPSDNPALLRARDAGVIEALPEVSAYARAEAKSFPGHVSHVGA